MAFKIYLSPPQMGGREIEFVQQAFDTNWIAPYGPSINAFEQEMSGFVGVESAVALTSGTAAIHLALRWFGVGEGDLVFCSDLTFIGSCCPVLYQGAVPVFIDSEPSSWNMSPVALEKAFGWARRQGKMPKAVIIVDLYGESADWDQLLPICRKYGVPVIEDAAEAVGTVYKDKRCGSFGDVSVISFNGNKILTTSGGGMALSENAMAIERMRFWSTQAREPYIHYEHAEYGYNYRMSNVCAAIGRGQLLFLPEKLALRRKIYATYQKELCSIPAHIKRHAQENSANCWLNMLVLDPDSGVAPAELVTRMQNAEIESRPAWKPMHMQPVFRDAVCFSHREDGFVSEDVFETALCLPSGDGLTALQQARVISEVRRCFLPVSEKGAS